MPAAFAQAAALSPATTFLETFDGNPAAPQPWRPRDWLNSVVTSNVFPTEMSPADVGHGPDCAGPPATHRMSGAAEDMIFLCKDHVMTASRDSSAVAMVPPVLLDLSQGEGVVRWDMSTLGSSAREYAEIWVVPWEEDLQVVADGSRHPWDGVQMYATGGDPAHLWWDVNVKKAGQYVFSSNGGTRNMSAFLEPSASRRDAFELVLSKDHIRFCMPAYGECWADAPLPAGAIEWDKALVYFELTGYNPPKGQNCYATPADCGMDTWHWDNLQIAPAQRFTVISPDKRIVGADEPLAFDRPAPAGSLLRFWADGFWGPIEVSPDDGATWGRVAPFRDSRSGAAEAFKVPVPAGTQRVRVRGADGNRVWAVDARLVSLAAPDGSPPPTAVPPAATATAAPAATATPAPRASPTAAAPTPVPTATPPPAATATPVASTATSEPAPLPVCLAGELRDGRFFCSAVEGG